MSSIDRCFYQHDMNTTFIYALIDPETHEVRYVGKSDNPYKRFLNHLLDKMELHKVRWIQLLLGKGLKPEWTVLEQCDKSIWQERERDWISFGKRIGWPLTNLTDGGDGGSFKGRHHSEESRMKISIAGIGRRHTNEAKEKMSISQRGKHYYWSGKQGPMTGRHHSEETKRKISESEKGKIVWNKDKKLSEEHRRRLSESHMGHRHSEETKRKMSMVKIGRKV